MPLKKCPKCGCECGPRTKTCPECQHPFSSVSQNKESAPKKRKQRSRQKPSDKVIAHGTWVYQQEKGMPKIYEPGELPDEPLTKRDVQDYVAYEGLGFCIMHYIYPERIESKRLAQKWIKAKQAMKEVVEELYV